MFCVQDPMQTDLSAAASTMKHRIIRPPLIHLVPPTAEEYYKGIQQLYLFRLECGECRFRLLHPHNWMML